MTSSALKYFSRFFMHVMNETVFLWNVGFIELTHTGMGRPFFIRDAIFHEARK
jgi:hypothetical protein